VSGNGPSPASCVFRGASVSRRRIASRPRLAWSGDGGVGSRPLKTGECLSGPSSDRVRLSRRGVGESFPRPDGRHAGRWSPSCSLELRNPPAGVLETGAPRCPASALLGAEQSPANSQITIMGLTTLDRSHLRESESYPGRARNQERPDHRCCGVRSFGSKTQTTRHISSVPTCGIYEAEHSWSQVLGLPK
jgi:hypothetical protein